MARLALLFAVFASGCCSIEQLATSHHGTDHASAQSGLERVISDCQFEAGRQQSRRFKVMPPQYTESYLNACYREVTIMRAYGRR